MRALLRARAGVRAWRSRPLEVHERAVHGARAEAGCVLRVGGEDEREGGGGARGPRGPVAAAGGRRGARGGVRVLRQTHEQGLLAAQDNGLVDGEEGHDGLLPARAPGAASREAADVGARDAERGRGVRLGARREPRAVAGDEAVAAQEGSKGGAARAARAHARRVLNMVGNGWSLLGLLAREE